MHHLIRRFFMTGKAGQGHFRPGFKWSFEEILVINGRRSARHEIPWVVYLMGNHGCFSPGEIPNRNRNQDQQKYKAGDPAFT